MLSNTFRIFGLLILALLVFFVINRASTAKEPVAKATVGFMDALASGSQSALEPYLDPDAATLVAAGDRVTVIKFKELNFTDSAFSRRPAVTYNYLELKAKRVNLDERPVTLPEQKIATVPLIDGGSIYLREREGQWVVFYISTAEQEKAQ